MKVVTFPAMGTTITAHCESARLGVRVIDVVEAHEQRFSRFRPTSELSRINRDGQDGIAVSQDMREVLTVADDLRVRTSGLVDVGVGAAVSGWGYSTTFDEVTEQEEAPTTTFSSGWRIDGEMVWLQPGAQIDLGGVAKGWVCDRLVDERLATVASCGGDIRSNDASLLVEITNAEGENVASVALGIGAMATSSRTKRSWSVGSSVAHHIIDPRTMAPAQSPVASASVIASTAVEAEAGAKAVLIHGRDGLAWAESQHWIERGIVTWHDGSVYANTLGVAS